jgi:hypothetical protein
MHPTIAYQVAKDRIADWRRPAGHDRIARAVRPVRRNHASHPRPGHLATVLARRVGAPSLRPPAQPGQMRKAAP